MQKQRIVVAVTGASGAIYAKVLFDTLQVLHEQIESVGVVMSDNAKQVWKLELKNEHFKNVPFTFYDKNDFNQGAILATDERYNLSNFKEYTSHFWYGQSFPYESFDIAAKVTQDNTVSVSENVKQNFSVYPNPSNGNFIVDFSSKVVGNTTLSLRNMLGQVVFSESVNGVLRKSIDASQLEKGVYFLTVSSANAEQTQKVVIK